jgi:uncharacterized protein (DUF1330 family)
MKCYMIVFGHFSDLPRFMDGYQRVVGPLVEKFGGRYVFMGSDASVLEGPWSSGGGCVISEWPDRAAALRFWNSAEYAAAKQLRAGTGEFQVVLYDAPDIGTLPTP